MSFDLVAESLWRLSFHEAVWFFPLAFVLHVCEEWPSFTAWARRYASERFTRRDYVMIHVAGMILALLSAGVLWLLPSRLAVFVFFAFVFAPAVLFNSIFHAGATAVSSVYCPGLLTAIVSYLPLFYFLSRLAFREGLLTAGTGILALVIAGVFHVMEVGHNVYKAW